MTKEEFLEQCEEENFISVSMEDDWEYTRTVPSISKETKEHFIDSLLETEDFQKDFPAMTSVEQVISYARDLWDESYIYTESEYNKEQGEKRRRNLQDKAKQLAHGWNVQVDSFEFVQKLESSIDERRSRREGMKEDGLCIGWGATVEQWFDDYNSYGSDINAIIDLLEWMDEECPLLMMKHRENQLKEEVQPA